MSVCVWVFFAWEVGVCFVLHFLHELFLTYLKEKTKWTFLYTPVHLVENGGEHLRYDAVSCDICDIYILKFAFCFLLYMKSLINRLSDFKRCIIEKQLGPGWDADQLGVSSDPKVFTNSTISLTNGRESALYKKPLQNRPVNNYVLNSAMIHSTVGYPSPTSTPCLKVCLQSGAYTSTVFARFYVYDGPNELCIVICLWYSFAWNTSQITHLRMINVSSHIDICGYPHNFPQKRISVHT